MKFNNFGYLSTDDRLKGNDTWGFVGIFPGRRKIKGDIQGRQRPPKVSTNYKSLVGDRPWELPSIHTRIANVIYSGDLKSGHGQKEVGLQTVQILNGIQPFEN